MTIILLSWVADTVKLLGAISWPIVGILAIAVLLISGQGPALIKTLLRRVTSVKFMGAEVELSEATARQITENVNDSLQSYRKLIDNEYGRQVRIHEIQSKFGRVARKVVKRVGNERDLRLRCAIHIEDLMFSDLLYQLTNYYPGNDGQGRTKSIRFGIIGRAWRETQSQDQENVVPEDLVKHWGLTRMEADMVTQDRQSFFATILTDQNNVPVGIFFLDAVPVSAFGNENQRKNLHEFILTECANIRLPNSISGLRSEMSKTVASFHIQ